MPRQRNDPDAPTIHYSRYRLGRNLVTIMRQALDHIVIAILMRDEERASQRTVVGIQAILGEYLLVMIEVVVIYCTIECHYYHLRRLESFESLYLCLNRSINEDSQSGSRFTSSG